MQWSREQLKELGFPSRGGCSLPVRQYRCETAVRNLLSVTLKELGEHKSVSGEYVDVSDATGVAAAAAATVKKHGKVDILVANAGIAGPNHTTWEYPIDTWKQVININLVGVFLCCRAFVLHMLRQGYGRIVNVASIEGKEGNANASAYSASKAGVIALTKSLGKETANQNISVNCITPAAARTRIFEQLTKEHIDFMLSKIPLAASWEWKR